MGTRITNLPTAETLTDDMYIAVDGTDGTYKTLLKNVMGKGGIRINQLVITDTLQTTTTMTGSGEVNS